MKLADKIIDNQMITRCIQYFFGEMVLGLHHFSMANTHHAPEGCGWGSPRKTIALMTSVSHTPQQGLAPGASENFESESLNIRMGPQVGHANPISATNAATNAPIFAFNVRFFDTTLVANHSQCGHRTPRIKVAQVLRRIWVWIDGGYWITWGTFTTL